MRFQPQLSTYPHNSQRKKKYQKERKDYDYSFALFNPEGTDHLLLKGDILTCYEHPFSPYPLMTPIGRIRTTFFAIPAR